MNETKAARYQRLKRRAHAAGVASGIAMLAVVALTPVCRLFANAGDAAARGLSGFTHDAIALVVFVGALVVLWEIVALPAVLYLGLNVDRRYRRAERTIEGLVAGQAQALLIAFPAAFVAAAIVLISIGAAGAWWWIAAGALLSMALVAALRAAPWLLARIADSRPIDRPLLEERLRELAGRAGVSIARVYEWRVADGPTHTALVSGVGRTRSVFISSAMIRHWSNDEIAVVVAHELGHHAHHDLWRALALDAAVLTAALGVAHATLSIAGMPLVLDDLMTRFAALPMIALVAGGVWFAMTPIRHAFSRALERRADRFALSLTGHSEAFDNAIRRLSSDNLAEEEPSLLTRWMYHRHPTMGERLATSAKMKSS